MKLSELMAGKTPSTDYEGFVTNDDMVLAVNIGGSASANNPDEYVVVQMGISGLDSNMNPVTQDKQYIRAGQSTTKTGTQRTFTISGDRYIGDEFQDYAMSREVMYGVGNAVVADYVYFCILNGKGEKGQCSIIVNSDASGSAGESAGVDIELRKIGSEPADYTYTASSGV